MCCPQFFQNPKNGQKWPKWAIFGKSEIDPDDQNLTALGEDNHEKAIELEKLGRYGLVGR